MGSSAETWYSENFMESMRAILVRTTSSDGYSLNWPSPVAKQGFQSIGCIWLSCWMRRSCEDLQITQADLGQKDGLCKLTGEGVGAGIAKDIHTAFVTWGGLAGVCMESSPLCSSLFHAGTYSAGYQKTNLDANPAKKPL